LRSIIVKRFFHSYFFDTLLLWHSRLINPQDAFAVLLSAYHPSLHLLGISTVHGNASITHTTYNATSLLTAMGATHIPVYRGAEQGICRPPVHAEDIHGKSGLDGTELLPVPAVKHIDEPAVDAMATALLKKRPGTAWVIATGALTNVAQCFSKYPELASHVKGLSLMGGAVGDGFTTAVMGKVEDRERIGNWSNWAEFNILVDPEAAHLLFSNPILNKKIIMIPLDVTHQVLATKEVQALLLEGKSGREKSTLRTMLVELLTFFAHTYAEVFGIVEGPPLHDPLAVAVVLDGVAGAEIPFYDFEKGKKGRKERFKVDVVTDGTHEDALLGAETGRTVVKLLAEGEEGVKIPRSLDTKRFWSILEECLGRADEVNRENGVA
jgi:uridine nucleosidase